MAPGQVGSGRQLLLGCGAATLAEEPLALHNEGQAPLRIRELLVDVDWARPAGPGWTVSVCLISAEELTI